MFIFDTIIQAISKNVKMIYFGWYGYRKCSTDLIHFSIKTVLRTGSAGVDFRLGPELRLLSVAACSLATS